MKRLETPLALLIALIHVGLLAGIALDKSETYDESVYLRRSAQIFKSATDRLPTHWQAPQWSWAAALWLADPDGDRGRMDLGPGLRDLARRHPESWPRLLLAARAPSILATVAAGLWLWRSGRRSSPGCGLAAQALWAFSPNLLAHGGLVNLDAWAAAWSSLLLLCAIRFLERPSPSRAAQAGIPLALAAATKLPALAALPVLALVMAWAVWRGTPRGARGRALLRVAAALAFGSFLSLWVVFAFTFGSARGAVLSPFGVATEFSLGPIPAPTFFETLATQALYGAQGKTSYLFGEVRTSGWWWFYLAVLALKTTLGAQALFMARFLALPWSPPAERRQDLVLLAAPALLLVVMSIGRAQGGVRYLLPAFPFVLLFLARGLPEAARAFGPWGRAAWLSAAGLGIAGSLSVYPHSLMFFNTWAGGPSGGPRYLIHGDDWGQDMRRLALWQREHGLPTLFYTYYGANPDLWGLQWERAPCLPRKGIFALHAEEVHRHGVADAGCLDWLTLEQPDERIGYSIYIYVVDRRRLERLAESCDTPRPFFRSGKGGPPCDRLREKVAPGSEPTGGSPPPGAPTTPDPGAG